MRGSNKMMRRGGSEWHREMEDDDDHTCEGEGDSDGTNKYSWRDPNKIKVVCDIAFDTLEVDDIDFYRYMYTLDGWHYFRHTLKGYLRTKEV